MACMARSLLRGICDEAADLGFQVGRILPRQAGHRAAAGGVTPWHEAQLWTPVSRLPSK